MHDADSHIMEPADWLHPYLDAPTRERFPLVWNDANEDTTPGDAVERAAALHHDPAYRADDAAADHVAQELPRDRLVPERRPRRARSTCSASRASSCSTRSRARTCCASIATATTSSRSALARAQHRAVLDWCSVDPRLLPVTVVPVGDTAAAVALTARGDRRGQRRDLDRPVPGRALAEPRRRSNRCGPRARRRACRSCCTSRGAGANVMPPDFFDNGLPPVPDFHGGDTNFKSIDYLSIPLPVMQTLNALIIDGVLMRHPGAAHRRDRARRHVGAGLDALARLGARGVPQERDPAAGDGAAAERVRAAPGARHAVPARGHGLDHREQPATTCACSRPTSRTSRAAATRSRASNAAWTRPASSADARERFYVDNFVDLLGPVLDRRGVSIAADGGVPGGTDRADFDAYDSRVARNTRRQTAR